MQEGSSSRTAPATGRATTIYDIARVAAVSPSTVSRALTRPGRIAKDTEQRVRMIAEQLNYRVNPIARALHTGKTFTLALVVADIANPVVFDIVRGAEAEAAKRGYTLVVAESQESPDREASTLARLLPSVDGVILGTTRLDDDRVRELGATKRVAVINRVVDGVACIVPRPEAGVDDAIDDLDALGHRRIVYVPGPSGAFMTARRLEAIERAASARGIRVDVLRRAAPTVAGGRSAWALVAASPATAVFAYNDLVAIGLLKQADARGVSIPKERSIIGFDDIFGADFTSPALSTVRAPLVEAGRRAVTAMFEDYDDAVDPLATRYVRRGSVATPASTTDSIPQHESRDVN